MWGRVHVKGKSGQRKRRRGLVTNNIPHTIYSGGNLLVNCTWEMWKKTDFLFYLKIIIEFQSMFNWIAKYWQAQNNDNNNITYLQKKQKQHKKHILESAANITSTCKLYLVAIFILLNWKSIVNYRWMNSSWFHCMFSSLYPELCDTGHLKYVSV